MSFQDAQNYRNKRRNLAPKLYEERRLRELPTTKPLPSMFSNNLSQFFRIGSPAVATLPTTAAPAAPVAPIVPAAPALPAAPIVPAVPVALAAPTAATPITVPHSNQGMSNFLHL